MNEREPPVLHVLTADHPTATDLEAVADRNDVRHTLRATSDRLAGAADITRLE